MMLLGERGGREGKFETDNAVMVMPTRRGSNGRGYGQPPQPQMPLMGYGQPRAPDAPASQDTDKIARQAQQKIAPARAMSGGQPSGQPMFILADTLQQVESATKKSGGKRWGAFG